MNLLRKIVLFTLATTGGLALFNSSTLRADDPIPAHRPAVLFSRWSGGDISHDMAMLYDRTEKKARPIGVFEGKAWATVKLHGQDDLFVGHPVTCDNGDVTLQVSQVGDDKWKLEVHNPGDSDVTVNLKANPFFDPLKDKKLPSEPVEIKAGTSQYFDL